MQTFFKKDVLKNFVNFTRKHLCWSRFLIKLAWRPATLLKKTPTQVFSYEICKILKNTFFTEHLWSMLMIVTICIIQLCNKSVIKNKTCHHEKLYIANLLFIKVSFLGLFRKFKNDYFPGRLGQPQLDSLHYKQRSYCSKLATRVINNFIG